MQTHIMIALIGLSIAGCQKPVAVEEAADFTRLPAELEVTPPMATPLPVPVVPKAYVEPPPPDVQTKAPDGIFFLLIHKSVMTTDGITGFPLGTQVKLIRPGIYSADGQELELRETEVTNDLAMARSIRHLDIQKQAAVRIPEAAPEPVAPLMSVGPARVEYAPAPSGALDVSSALGTSHSRYKDGWKWQKDGSGQWVRVERLK